jgi:hypothetical protein
MIPWILVNVLLFLAVILLTLPYLLRAIRNRWEGDVVAIVVIVAVCCYLVLGLPPSAAGGAAGFSWVTFAYMAVLFVCDIIDIVIGIPQPKPKEKKEDK